MYLIEVWRGQRWPNEPPRMIGRFLCSGTARTFHLDRAGGLVLRVRDLSRKREWSLDILDCVWMVKIEEASQEVRHDP